jgi:hypothetical protein
MAKPLPSRNIPYQFNGDRFRNAIRFVFEMGAPPEDGIGLVFHFSDTVTFTGPSDSNVVPFDPTQAATRETRTPVTVPCDVEFVSASEQPTAFGGIIPAKLKVLLLDDDYEKVADAIFVVMNGDRYNRQYEEPSFGLFDVGLHTMVFQAEDEI